MFEKEYLQRAAEAVDAALPDHHGFILLAVPFEGGDGRIKYVSSLKREDAILVLKEWLIKCGHEEDWMKHIK
jgi:hypothetical protein